MSKICVKNVYYMLAYAFSALREKEFRDLETESFEEIDDLLASVLVLGVTGQLKRGLLREYWIQTEPLSVLRGKIDLIETFRLNGRGSRRLVCRFDEFAEDNLMNRVIKKTLLLLLRSQNVKRENRHKIRRLLTFFANVSPLENHFFSWRDFNFHRNNAAYRLILGICRLILDREILSEDSGAHRLRPFEDDAAMCRLYEKFILRYFQKHYPQLNASPRTIPWDLGGGSSAEFGESDEADYLPAMKTDITLSYGGRTLIIDAKYYSRTMQTNPLFGTQTYHSGNLYQIFAYVKNCDTQRTGRVEGLLLYAKTDEEITPNASHILGGNRITVRTLDLSRDWENLDRQLQKIGESFKNQGQELKK